MFNTMPKFRAKMRQIWAGYAEKPKKDEEKIAYVKEKIAYVSFLGYT